MARFLAVLLVGLLSAVQSHAAGVESSGWGAIKDTVDEGIMVQTDQLDPAPRPVVTANKVGGTREATERVGDDNIVLRNGDLVTVGDEPAAYLNTYYVMSDGMLRQFSSNFVFEALGYSYGHAQRISERTLGQYRQGESVTSAQVHPNGALVKNARDTEIYLVQNSQKRQFVSDQALYANRYELSRVITIPYSEWYQYPDGPPITGWEPELTAPVDGRYYGRLTLDVRPSGLIVSSTKAGGWRGQGKQPQVAIIGNWRDIPLYRGHATYMPFVVWNFQEQAVVGADVRIHYDPNKVTIGIDDRYTPEGFFLEANTTVPGLLIVQMASAMGTKEDVLMFFQIIVTPPSDAPLGSTVSFITEIVFYNEEAEDIGSQTVIWRLKVGEW